MKKILLAFCAILAFTIASNEVVAQDYTLVGPFTHTGVTVGTDANECAQCPGEDITYRVILPCAGSWTFKTCGPGGSINNTFPTKMYLGTSLCGGEIGISTTAGSCRPKRSDTTIVTVSPTIVYVVICGRKPAHSGRTTLTVAKSGPPCPPPGNIVCSGGAADTVVTDGGPFLGNNTFVPGTGTYPGGVPPICSPFPPVDDTLTLWYIWTPENDCEVDIGLCGSTFDTHLAILDGCPDTGAVSTVACNNRDNTACGPGNRSFINDFNPIAGKDYYIRVSGHNGSSGATVLTLDGFPGNVNVPDWSIDAPDTLAGPNPYVGTRLFEHAAAGLNDSICLRPSDDNVVCVAFSSTGSYCISLCGTTFPSYMYLGTGLGLRDIGENDNGCSEIPNGKNGEMTYTVVSAPDTIYVTIEGDKAQHGGRYTLSVSSGACGGPILRQGAATLDVDGVEIEAYPNPFNDLLTMEVSSEEEGDMNILITNMIGQTVYSQSVAVSKGLNTYYMNMNDNMTHGIYNIIATMGDKVFNLRVVKQQ